MSKIRVTKEFSFETAHALHGYDGKCKHIHGHTFGLSVTVIGEPVAKENNPKKGMVIDFGDLKKIVHEHIVKVYDHALIINKINEGILLPEKHEMFQKVILVDYQPTSENMVIEFAGIISKFLPEGVILHHLRLRETNTSYAEWFAEDN